MSTTAGLLKDPFLTKTFPFYCCPDIPEHISLTQTGHFN